MNVPKEMRETYEEISNLLIEYSEKYPETLCYEKGMIPFVPEHPFP